MGKQNKNHSFYKEANKSILGQQQWTFRKVLKSLFTVSKWLLFMFLIVITLWGCVMEFILHTSKNLGQGVEFYQKDDFIYPNMYQAEEVVTYQATNATSENVADYTDGDVDATFERDASDVKSTGFDQIWVTNPLLGLDDSVLNDSTIYTGFEDSAFEDSAVPSFVNTNDTHLGATQAYTVEYNKNDNGDVTSVKEVVYNPTIYAYNLSELFLLSGGILGYDWNDLAIDGGFLAPYSDNGNVPQSRIEAANKVIEKADIDEDYDYTVSSIISYAFYLVDSNDDSFNGKVDLEDTTFTWSDDAKDGKLSEVKAFNGIINYGATTDADVIIDNFEGKGKNEATVTVNKLINYLAFLSGDLTIDETGELPLEETIVYPIIKEAIDAVNASDEIEGEYTETYLPKVDRDSLSSGTVIGGAQLFILPISKGQPITLTQESKDIIDGENGEGGLRPADVDTYYDDKIDFEHYGDAYDPETFMYGWALLDAKSNGDNEHDLIKVFGDKKTAYSNELDDPSSEANYFYGDQRRLGWGTVGNGTTTTTEAAADVPTVLDEKIKEWTVENAEGGGSFINMSRSFSIGDEELSFDTYSKLAGLTTMEQIQITDSSFRGVLPQLQGYDVNGNAISDQDKIVSYGERSLVSDSIIPTGQDAVGETRATFTGWGDWDKAFDISYGPLYGFVVFPLAQISMGVGEWFNYAANPWGTLASIALIVFLTRGLAALFSLKGTKNQLKMQEVQTDVAKIKARYSKYDLKKDKRMKQKQQQEIMALYRKNDVNPMGSLGTIFITMPIFISLWIIISALPAYKLVIMGNFSWAVSAWAGIFSIGGWILLIYVLVGIAVGLTQGISSKLPSWLANKRKGIKRLDDATKEAQKKNNKTQNIMVGVFIFMGLTVPALFAFYWICSGLFTISLELMRHGWRTHTAEQIKLDPSYQTPGAKLVNSVKNKLTK